MKKRKKKQNRNKNRNKKDIKNESVKKMNSGIFIKLIFIALSAFYLLFAYNTCISNYTGGGDSPYFLLTIKSLVEDGDIFISKRESEYLNYAEEVPFRLDATMRLIDQEKHRYSQHPYGVVFTAAPFYYIGKKIDALYGRLGVLWGLSLINILAALIFYKIARYFLVSQWISLTITMMFFSCPPVMGISSLIYPGSPYYLAYFGMIFLLIKKPLNIKLNTVLICMLGAFISFLHMRYAPVVIFTYLSLFVFRKKKDFPQVHWLTLVAACTALLSAYMMFSASITGETFIDAIFKTSGSNTVSSFSIRTFLRQGMLGYLVDQQMGILITVPILGLSFAGLRKFYLDKKYHFLLLFIPAFVSYVFVASYYKWAGQWGILSRFMIPSLPALFIGLGYTIKLIVERGSPFPKIIFSVFALSHIVLSIATFIYPSLLLPMNPTYKDAITNQNPYFVALYNKTGFNLIDYFPEFVYTVEYDDFILAACFILLFAVVNLLLLGYFRRYGKIFLIISFLSACVIFYTSGIDSKKYKSPIESDRRWSSTPMKRLFNYDRIYIKWGEKLLDARPEKAEIFLRKALWVNKDSIEANYLYLLLNAKQRKLDMAVKYFSEVCRVLKYTKISGNILKSVKQIRIYLHNQITNELNMLKSNSNTAKSNPDLKKYENMLKQLRLGKEITAF